MGCPQGAGASIDSGGKARRLQLIKGLYGKLTADKDSLALAAPLGIAFAKHLGHLYLPPLASATSSDPDFPTLAEATEPESEDTIVTREVRDKFRKLLVAYLDALGRREGKDHIVRI